LIAAASATHCAGVGSDRLAKHAETEKDGPNVANQFLAPTACSSV
jgi:hypothetical protein